MKKLVALLAAAAFVAPVSAFAGCDRAVRDALEDTRRIMPEGGLLEVPFTDIHEAWVRPADGYPATELGIRPTEPLMFLPGVNVNAFFYFDGDGDRGNNAPDGIRAGADSAYSLIYGTDRGEWFTKSWRYDAASGEWRGEENPSVLWALDGGALIMHVPFEFLPKGTDAAWRAALAAFLDGETVGDSLPDGEGELIDCLDDEAVVVSGLREEPRSTPGPEADQAASPSKPRWPWLVALLVISSLVSLAKQGLDKTRKQPVPSEEPSGQRNEEERSCDCPSCRAFLVVGNPRNQAIRGAANLGLAIKRDTEKPGSGVSEKDRCLKVVHFHDDGLDDGRRVESDGRGAVLDLDKFSSRAEILAEEAFDKICLWKEVMVVHHGERRSHVKNIIRGLGELIPRAPIERLVLYYCGGERTLPQAEFRALASDLGRRLKKIPEKCRPSAVHVYLAPTVDYLRKPVHTKLLLEKGKGLVSFGGLMKHYSVDEEGVVTEHGNEAPPGGQLFGNVPLGQLHDDKRRDSEVYKKHFPKLGAAPVSELRRYREIMDEAGIDQPRRRHKKEIMADEVDAACDAAGKPRMSAEQLDLLTEAPRSERRRILREHLGR